jgi:hypothetical protein
MVTFSILGRAEGTSGLGVALQSRFPGAGRRWELVLGSGKYDDRINDGVAVDVEVLADLRRTYGRRPAG